MSKDIEATIGAMTALGAEFEVNGGDITVKGSGARRGSGSDNVPVDCAIVGIVDETKAAQLISEEE
jgi:3-phosphoshikimate 1-carboxyvinyltransferase